MVLKKDNLYTKYSGVIELTMKDFIIENKKIIINNKKFKNKYGLIVFYSPSCGHCIKMVEMWSDLAIQFKNLFIIAAVNCEKGTNRLICDKLGIIFYPTIKYVTKNSLIYNYQGNYQKDELIYYICSKL